MRGEAPWCVACHPPSMSTGAFIQLYYAHYTRQCQPALITYAALARASASCCQNTTTENENISTFFDKAKGTHVHVLFSPLHGHRHLPHDDVVKTVLQQLRRRLQVAAQARVCRSPQAPPSTATQATRHSAPRLHTFICRSVPFSSSVNITSDSVLVATQGTHRRAQLTARAGRTRKRQRQPQWCTYGFSSSSTRSFSFTAASCARAASSAWWRFSSRRISLAIDFDLAVETHVARSTDTLHVSSSLSSLALTHSESTFAHSKHTRQEDDRKLPPR